MQKQLKKQYPNWHRLSRKFKEEISRKVLAHFVSGYDFSQEITKPPEKLLGIEQQVSTNEIITLENMAEYISSAKNSRIVKFCDYKRSPIYIKDKDGTLFSETGTIVTTPPSAKVALPKHTDGDTGAVFCHDECPFPMVHAGIEGQNHGYKCSATPCSCI